MSQQMYNLKLRLVDKAFLLLHLSNNVYKFLLGIFKIHGNYWGLDLVDMGVAHLFLVPLSAFWIWITK
jgi:hypothetical protein